jgi:hypothetical protein
MRQLPRAGSLVVALLLASVGTASSECAWVLWTKSERVNFTPGTVQSDGWETESAAPTYDECSRAARKRAERVGTKPDKSNLKSAEFGELIGGGYRATRVYAHNETMSASWEFRCFPDTIDPRGSKAK